MGRVGMWLLQTPGSCQAWQALACARDAIGTRFTLTGMTHLACPSDLFHTIVPQPGTLLFKYTQ